jgi:riboflavin synthase alpha subunit
VLTVASLVVIEGVKLGDSICTNGVCLTVTSFDHEVHLPHHNHYSLAVTEHVFCHPTENAVHSWFVAGDAPPHQFWRTDGA